MLFSFKICLCYSALSTLTMDFMVCDAYLLYFRVWEMHFCHTSKHAMPYFRCSVCLSQIVAICWTIGRGNYNTLFSSVSSLCITGFNKNLTRKLISKNYLANTFNNYMKVITGNVLLEDKNQFFVYNTGFGCCLKYLCLFFIIQFI